MGQYIVEREVCSIKMTLGYLSAEGSSSPPTVVVFQPLLPDQRSPGPVVLVCLVRGLPDSQVSLHWTVNDEKINDGDATSEASVDTDGSYSATGFLLVPVTHWHPNNIYRCIVNHGSHVYEGSRQASSCYYVK